jgi:hypothetical protein
MLPATTRLMPCFNIGTWKVKTTDFTDGTDEEEIGLVRAFTGRVSENKPLILFQVGYYPCNPWFLKCRIEVQDIVGRVPSRGVSFFFLGIGSSETKKDALQAHPFDEGPALAGR